MNCYAAKLAHRATSPIVARWAVMDDSETIAINGRKVIALDDDFELRYWTAALGVTQQELRSAVQAVGKRAADVRQFLGR